jgi:hypothetical protein
MLVCLQAEGIVTRLLSLESADAAYQRQGCLVALGYILTAVRESVPKELLADVLRRLQERLDDRRGDVVCSACRAIGLIGLEGAFGVEHGEAEEEPAPAKDAQKEGAAQGAQDERVTVMSIVRKLGALLAGKEKESKAYEVAAHALGSMCMTCREPALVSACTQQLLAASKHSRADEVHFSVGEALACIAGGRSYTSSELLCQLRLPSAYEDKSSDAQKDMLLWARADASMEETGDGSVMDSIMTRYTCMHTCVCVCMHTHAHRRGLGSMYING